MNVYLESRGTGVALAPPLHDAAVSWRRGALYRFCRRSCGFCAEVMDPQRDGGFTV